MAMASLFYGGGKPDDGAAAGLPQYLSTTTLHKHCKHQGLGGTGRDGGYMCPPSPSSLCVEIGFYTDIKM